MKETGKGSSESLKTEQSQRLEKISPTLVPAAKPPLACGYTAGGARGCCQRGNWALENPVVILFIPRTKNSPNPMAPPEEKWFLVFLSAHPWALNELLLSKLDPTGMWGGRKKYISGSVSEGKMSVPWLKNTTVLDRFSEYGNKFLFFGRLHPCFMSEMGFFVAFVFLYIQAFGSPCFLSWTLFQGSAGCGCVCHWVFGISLPRWNSCRCVSAGKALGTSRNLLTAQAGGSTSGTTAGWCSQLSLPLQSERAEINPTEAVHSARSGANPALRFLIL